MAKLCEYCHTRPVFSHKACKNCQWKRVDPKWLSKKEKNKNNAVKKKVGTKEKEKDGELDKFFAVCVSVIKSNPHCAECGEFISENDYRNSTAHLWPKNIFKSIATHPLNWLPLGNRCGCHNDWDKGVESACQMQVWSIAVDRWSKFKNKIIETHKYRWQWESVVDKMETQ